MGPVDVWFYCGAVGLQQAQHHRAAGEKTHLTEVYVRYIQGTFIHSRVTCRDLGEQAVRIYAICRLNVRDLEGIFKVYLQQCHISMVTLSVVLEQPVWLDGEEVYATRIAYMEWQVE